MADICIDIKINNPKREVSDESNIYHAHLILDNSTTEIILKIYYEDEPRFHREVEWRIMRTETFCKNLQFVKTRSNEVIENIDFSQSKVLGVLGGDPYFDNIGGKYIIVKIDLVRIVYPPFKEYQNTDLGKSQFYLNKAANKLIENLYAYDKFVRSETRNIWEAVNREDKFFQFGEVKIRLGYHFYSKENKLDDIEIIHKRPLLDIQHEGFDECQVCKYSNLIISVLSLYRNELIDFDLAHIFNSRERVEISKISSEVILSKYVGRLKNVGFEGNFIELLKAVQPEKILDEIDDFSKFCKKYLLGKKLSGESRFMIFYNLLEQIRNKYVTPEKLSQEYEFIYGKKKTNKLIKDKLREIAEAVNPKQREQFKVEVINHDRTIRLLPMRSQFQHLFDLFSIDLEKSELDFGNIKKMRDKIYHGHPINNEDDIVFLQKANKELPILAGKLLLKMIGVEIDVEKEYFIDI